MSFSGTVGRGSRVEADLDLGVALFFLLFFGNDILIGGGGSCIL